MNGSETDAQRLTRPVDTAAPRPGEVHKDITLALALAKHSRAAGERVAALRRRLAAHAQRLTGQ